jgi:hypothetical protein
MADIVVNIPSRLYYMCFCAHKTMFSVGYCSFSPSLHILLARKIIDAHDRLYALFFFFEYEGDRHFAHIQWFNKLNLVTICSKLSPFK